MLELERRWKVQKEDIPFNEVINQYQISQVYSSFSPDVRIRKITSNSNDTYVHTVKYFLKDNKREEIEQHITEEQYNNIFDYIDKKPVVKNRMIIPLDSGLKAEIDHFLDTDEYVVEVEFNDENQMNVFIPMSWFGQEIKDKQSYNVKIFKFINQEKSIFEEIQNSVRLVK
jgi:CYTH domain-containing protein